MIFSRRAAALAAALILAGVPAVGRETAREPASKIIEGSPERGLPYRLTMAQDATEAKASRVVVWLHPSGGPFIRKVEELAPVFLKHRLALLVITEKESFKGWTREDALRLFGVTLPEVAGITGIDARRPLLMGFSAGGQLALKLWHIRPADFGGFILDAAYPTESHENGDQTVLDPPAADGVTSVPLFVLVGAKDDGSDLWRKTARSWRKAGVPLTIRYVRGKVHEWLFGEEEIAALDAWLSTVPGVGGGGGP
ncbi:MAG TPA: hypothetical protein VE404_03710 [Verrucomicrobiae bacterium]|nr:hypothetical protein [Verrucomicrobiae bacterium]